MRTHTHTHTPLPPTPPPASPLYLGEDMRIWRWTWSQLIEVIKRQQQGTTNKHLLSTVSLSLLLLLCVWIALLVLYVFITCLFFFCYNSFSFSWVFPSFPLCLSFLYPVLIKITKTKGLISLTPVSLFLSSLSLPKYNEEAFLALSLFISFSLYFLLFHTLSHNWHVACLARN